ncbi:MAG: Gldg family protein [Planctomycetales bacterium]|nr:Gldg family protein [Planctomycetales bacterium]
MPSETPATAAAAPPAPPKAAGGFGAGVRLASGLNVALLFAFAAAAVVFLNAIVAKRYMRFDWTSGGVFGLSPKTKSFLGKVTKPIKLVVLYPPAGQGGPSSDVHDLVREYELASPHVSFEALDPDRNPKRAEEIIRSYNLNPEEIRTGVIVDHLGKSKWVGHSKIFEQDFSGGFQGGGAQTKFKGEDQLTSAIVSLAEGKTPKAGFLKGHGEKDPNGGGEEGCAGAKEALRRDNYEVEAVELKGKDSIPAGLDFLVIAGPRGTILPEEVHLVKAHLEGGGKLLVLLDPSWEGRTLETLRWTRTGLEELLQEWGVEIGDDLLLENVQNGPFLSPASRAFPITWRSSSHEITKSLAAFNRLMVADVRSVRYDDKGRGKTTGEAILKTSEGGMKVTDLVGFFGASQDMRRLLQYAETLTPEQHPIGAAVEAIHPASNGEKARLVVIGTSSLVADAGTPKTYELDLFVNAANWLARREALLGISAKDPTRVKFTMTGGQVKLVFWISVVLLPLGAFLLGGVVWLIRRS